MAQQLPLRFVFYIAGSPDKVWKGFVRIDLADDVGTSQYLEVMNDSLS